jgi:hypothetical protein
MALKDFRSKIEASGALAEGIAIARLSQVPLGKTGTYDACPNV